MPWPLTADNTILCRYGTEHAYCCTADAQLNAIVVNSTRGGRYSYRLLCCSCRHGTILVSTKTSIQSPQIFDRDSRQHKRKRNRKTKRYRDFAARPLPRTLTFDTFGNPNIPGTCCPARPSVAGPVTAAFLTPMSKMPVPTALHIDAIIPT